jgi:hypothetical protein
MQGRMVELPTLKNGTDAGGLPGFVRQNDKAHEFRNMKSGVCVNKKTSFALNMLQILRGSATSSC